ncbi:MAG: enoyl-CoA hydratase-related protein [Anaerolineae bacterium]|jgi:enoyl-CoA hydratase/3-hydroxyacyl-CoA dehydrogenase
MNIKKVGVVGCGLMGAGIAQVAAQAGYETIVRELNEELLEKGLGRISAFLDKGVAKRKMTQAKRDATWARISGTTDLAVLADCDLVIEAVIENMQVKQQLFSELDAICHRGTILASNTSSLSIAEMAAATGRPDKVAGLHYFFPAVINQLLEVVAAEQTSDEVVEALLTFARAVGKVPILVKDAPGFAINRFFVPWLNEAARMLGEGLADIPTIDEAAREAFHIGMGPFALMNATGVPIAYHCAESFAPALGDFYAPAALLTAQVEAGQPWDLEGAPDEAAETAKAAVGERLLAVTFAVAAQLVEEGVASVEDVEKGALVGLRWAGGPFGMMNDLGLDRALELVERLAAHDPSLALPELLRRQAALGQPWTLRDVKLEIEDGIATITMNRPEAMNALNEKVLRELKESVAQVRDDSSVRVVIITGEGPAFVAGADIRAMMAKDQIEIRRFTRFGHGVLEDIERLEKPVVAAINGFALGGGLELALACDIRLASTRARMGFPEVGLGIFPGLGGTQRATRLLGKGRACELIFTGAQISAEEAANIGLVNRAVPPQQLMADARRLAGRIARQGPIAVGRAKAAINQALQVGLDVGLAFELEAVTLTFGTEDQSEGMAAFLERRKPEFEGQ